MINANVTLQELFTAACDAANNLVQPGETFIVRDLFTGIEWKRIPVGQRTKLGSMFFAWVNGTPGVALKPLGKTPQNQQIYTKN